MSLPALYKRIYTFGTLQSGRFLAVVIALVLIAGVFYTIALGEQLRFLPDEQDYFAIAGNLVQKGLYSLDGETPTAYRPPGYPFIIAILRWFGAGVRTVRYLNFVLFAGSLYLLYRIIARQESRLPAFIGVVLTLAYPVLFFTAGTLYPQTLAAFLLLLVLEIITRETPGWWATLLSGLLLGYLVLTVPTFIIVLFLVGIWLGVIKPAANWRSALLALIVASLLIAGWTLRNHQVFDKYLFISTNSGENLLLGNNEQTTPNAGRTIDISAYMRVAESMNEVEADRYYRSVALEYIQTHKARTVWMYFLKFLNYFNYSNRLVTQVEGNSVRDLLMLFTYGPLLLLAVARVLSLRAYPLSRFEILLTLLYLAHGFVTALFFTRIRFRLPFDYLLIMLAAMFVSRWLSARAEPIGMLEGKAS